MGLFLLIVSRFVDMCVENVAILGDVVDMSVDNVDKCVEKERFSTGGGWVVVAG